jgi:hypothetical protein
MQVHNSIFKLILKANNKIIINLAITIKPSAGHGPEIGTILAF